LGGAQIHDFNPGIRQDGLFWSTVLDPEDVQVDLAAGIATVEVDDFHTNDYGDFENAITGDDGPPAPAIVSFKVQWTGTGALVPRNNAAQQFRGNFYDFPNTVAQIEYRIRTDDLDIVSAPLAASTTAAAEFGQESNGSFY